MQVPEGRIQARPTPRACDVRRQRRAPEGSRRRTGIGCWVAIEHEAGPRGLSGALAAASGGLSVLSVVLPWRSAPEGGLFGLEKGQHRLTPERLRSPQSCSPAWWGRNLTRRE